MRPAFVFLIILAACGGDDEVTPDGGQPPAPDAAPGIDAEPPPEAIAYAVGTDFATSGVLSKLEFPALAVTQDVVAGVASTDPVLRESGGKLYIVNRFGADNVTIVDLATKTLVEQVSTGAGSNPQDVAVKGDLLYVPALGSKGVLVVDLTDTGAPPAEIDLSSFDGDGKPDASSAMLVGDDLYVTLGLLDDTFTSQGGKVVVIDTTDDSVRADFDLVENNPIAFLQRFGDDLITATTDYAGTGCIERITTGATPAAGPCLATEAALGGYVSDLAVAGADVVAAVSTSFTEAKLVVIAPDGSVSPSITPSSQQPTDVAWCPNDRIVIGDAAGGGLRVYDNAGTELTAQPLDIGQPPGFTNATVCL
jgi:hypothetical protein